MTAHPGDLLSAYVDGELSPEGRAAVEAHLATCADCRREKLATEQAKRWVFDLPAVDAPFGFFERIMLDPAGPRRRRDRWAVRVGAASLAATASIWLAVVGLSGLDGNHAGGLPAFNSLVSLHEETPVAPAARESADQVVQQAQGLGLPAAMGPYTLASLHDRGAEQQATYVAGGRSMSVFVLVRYELIESRLPAGSRLELGDGRPAWVVPAGGSPVLVAQMGANVVVVVGPDPARPTMAAAVQPRSPDPSLTERLQGAGEGLLEAFGLG